MSYENWKDKIGTFEVMDVRGKKMDFFPALKAKAAALKNGEGLHIIQTFEPVPLYPVLALMGFEHHTEKVSGSEYHVWFYRVRKENNRMSYENWKNKAQGFQTVDVRHIQGSFFEGLKKRAEALEVGEGLHIIQTFEPHPLYAVMEGLGYEHHTEQRSEAEFHVWFCRVEKKEGDSSAPFKPLALLNYPMIDEKLGQIAVDFWETTWQSEKRVLPYETRLLLSLTNAVGAGRMRQAARELVKAYIHGVESAALDDVFELLAWNQGIGFFSSEIGPSALFQAYKLIKNGEKQGKSREDICSALREKFGEKNPEMQVLNR